MSLNLIVGIIRTFHQYLLPSQSNTIFNNRFYCYDFIRISFNGTHKMHSFQYACYAYRYSIVIKHHDSSKIINFNQSVKTNNITTTLYLYINTYIRRFPAVSVIKGIVLPEPNCKQASANKGRWLIGRIISDKIARDTQFDCSYHIVCSLIIRVCYHCDG